MNKQISIPFALAMAVLLAACPAVESEEWSDQDPAWVDGEFMVPTVCFFDELNGSGIAESGWTGSWCRNGAKVREITFVNF